MSTEHIVPQSIDPRLRAVYRNLLYACRFCNRARSNQPIWQKGRRLLDPSSTAWARHFELHESRLLPKSRNRHAVRTEAVYRMNRALQVGLRKTRKERMASYLRGLETIPGELRYLREKLMEADEPDEVAHLRETIDELSAYLKLCREEVKKLRPVPHDCSGRCVCSSKLHHSLPAPIRRQLIRVEL